jgi:hypothetical protein
VFDRAGRLASLVFASALVFFNQSVRGQINEAGGVVVFEDEKLQLQLVAAPFAARKSMPVGTTLRYSGIL